MIDGAVACARFRALAASRMLAPRKARFAAGEVSAEKAEGDLAFDHAGGGEKGGGVCVA